MVRGIREGVVNMKKYGGEEKKVKIGGVKK